MSYQVIDLNHWSRTEYFKFYQGMSHPWYNICTRMDVTALRQHCQAHKLRFFHTYLYAMQQALNLCTPIRYRLVDDTVRLYDQLSVSVAILGDDDGVRFCNIPYQAQFAAFSQAATAAEIACKQQPFVLAQFIGQKMQHDTVHMTVLPWLDFTSMSHARDTNYPDSVPKIAFGKLTQQDNRWYMPLSLEVHHGMMDGLHVGQFVATLQQQFDAF